MLSKVYAVEIIGVIQIQLIQPQRDQRVLVLLFGFVARDYLSFQMSSKKVMNVVATLLSLICFGWYLTHSIFPGPNCDPGTLSC